jgi:glycosyltransferase involved in cell wall biosynthesis
VTSAAPARRRIAIVVQRFGMDINGGAELHARLLAVRLAETMDVEVLTSCARDYTDWAMTYPPGPDTVAGLRVLRFAHPLRNAGGQRARVPLVHKLRFLARRSLRHLAAPLVLPPRGDADHDGLSFLRRQGPHCEGLLEHLRSSAGRYDAVIFFAALYEPTALGIQAWGRRSVLVPLLHDEKPMYLPVFHDVFRAAGTIVFNTASERRLASRLYGLDTAAMPVAGVGIDVQTPAPEHIDAVRRRHGIDGPYFVYVGRIDVAKGCKELLQAYTGWAAQDTSAQLVLVGQAVMPIPAHPRIVHTGFVGEDERDALIAGATALVIPSRYESLSMVTLEAMKLGVPVIANGECEVLDEHIRTSGAGLVYGRERSLSAALTEVTALGTEARRAMGAAGPPYVDSRYAWPHVLQQMQTAVDHGASLREA